MAPLEDCYRPDLVPPDAELKEEHTELAERLASGGVDFILIETMNTIREAYTACAAARETSKEVVVSFVCNREGNLLSGESLTHAVDALEELKPFGFSINCVSPRYIKQSISNLQSAISNLKSSCLLAAYGNVGLPESERSGWEFTHDINEDQYAMHAREWIRMGAAIVGGCCGTTPEYVRAVASVLGKT